MDIPALRCQIALLSHDPSHQIRDSDVLDTVKTANLRECKAVLDKIKEKIKQKKVCPQAKLRLLRLLAVCVRANNEHFVTYLVHKLLPRLAIFARHRKVGDM
jgi:predicted nucleic acid-binding OB-fold protein